MTTTNHTSPSGEELKRCPFCGSRRIAVDCEAYAECRSCGVTGPAVGDAAESWNSRAAARNQSIGEDAANGAIGERPIDEEDAFQDWWKTRKGKNTNAYHGWMARAALTAEKVAAEPTSIPFSAYRLKVAEECCERLMSACTDSGCPDGVNMADWIRQLAAPQQPAQSAEQGERSTGICFFCGEPIDGQHESDCPQSTATQPAQTQVALTEKQTDTGKD
jgi:hypothetical protein